MSRSHPSTFTITGMICWTKCVKETQAGSYKACYHVPSFGDNLSSAKKSFTVKSLHMNNNYAKKRGIGKKLLLTIRAVMLDEKVDLVAGDFNGAADATTATILVSLKRPLLTALCRCLPAPPRCGVLEQFQARGRTLVDSSNLLILMDNGKFVSTAHSPFPMKLLVSARLTRVATTKPGSTLT